MREILFRGKKFREYGENEWTEGCLLIEEDRKDKFRYRIRPTESGNMFAFPVYPETICQYTGLADKNGRKIWEGDILEAHLDEFFQDDVTREKVIWHENGWRTQETGCDDKEYLDEFDAENFEVIGNIFDNPELLEV